ncbi:amidohydrolase family protein [Aquamicrobium sp. LC103]|uniref:amidohydrolase family protein n=1 Tax=Aquamicrobium sp. LC103 TaxID=1120658 RepID=UPI00063ED2C2|nr:amidohydrolase family protein [Aquamicrobium sp. LC103]TKT74605.1 amidohydrolase [Aquamicrobium sp. LC103]
MSDAVLERETAQETKLGIVDCDIHPAVSTPDELLGFLPQRWRSHVKDYGTRSANPLVGTLPYPRMTPGGGMRRDAWPPSGGPPASDLAFMREQLLDPLDIEYGILQPLAAGSSTLNQELGAAMCTAINDWQIDKWTGPEPRLKGSICVTQEDTTAALAEIEARAADKSFVQIAIPPRTIEPAGRRRYWPIYEAAEHHGLPVGMHSAAAGVHTNSGTGWFSFYIEEHYAFAHSLQTVLTSMVFEGVFERFPKLKLVVVEGGFAWAAPLAWRLDREWRRMRSEVPHVKRPPSEYIRENVWFTTQPIEEPENNRHLLDTLRWMGTDRLMFSTDYPHWDFDDPRYAFKVPLTPAERAAIFRDNARQVYRLA